MRRGGYYNRSHEHGDGWQELNEPVRARTGLGRQKWCCERDDTNVRCASKPLSDLERNAAAVAVTYDNDVPVLVASKGSCNVLPEPTDGLRASSDRIVT